jgi:hypothetical protein
MPTPRKRKAPPAETPVPAPLASPFVPPAGMDKKTMLEELHKALIHNLLLIVKTGGADAATMNVARQMLKDNRIECLPEANPEMADLHRRLPFNPEAVA